MRASAPFSVHGFAHNFPSARRLPSRRRKRRRSGFWKRARLLATCAIGAAPRVIANTGVRDGRKQQRRIVFLVAVVIVVVVPVLLVGSIARKNNSGIIIRTYRVTGTPCRGSSSSLTTLLPPARAVVIRHVCRVSQRRPPRRSLPTPCADGRATVEGRGQALRERNEPRRQLVVLRQASCQVTCSVPTLINPGRPSIRSLARSPISYPNRSACSRSLSPPSVHAYAIAIMS